MSNIEKNNKKEELNISIDLSFINKFKTFLKSLNVKKIKEDLVGKKRSNKGNKKIFIFVVSLLLIVFIGNYSYNNYFFYKISKPYSDNMFVSDEYVDVISYTLEKGLRDNDFFKVFGYGNIDKKYKKNATLSYYEIKNGEYPNEKDLLNLETKYAEKGYKLGFSEISKKMYSSYLGNYDGKISPYKTDNFKKLDSNVSDKTIIAVYSTDTDEFLSYINGTTILRGLYDDAFYVGDYNDKSELFEFKDIVMVMNIDEEKNEGEIILKLDLYSEFTSDRELSIFTKSVKANASENDDLRNFQIDFSNSGDFAEIKFTFSGIRNFLKNSKSDIIIPYGY